jgi:hypothetical protein
VIGVRGKALGRRAVACRDFNALDGGVRFRGANHEASHRLPSTMRLSKEELPVERFCAFDLRKTFFCDVR